MGGTLSPALRKRSIRLSTIAPALSGWLVRMYSRMFSTDWKYFWESSRLLRTRPCPFECVRFATRSSRSKTLIYKLRLPKQKTSSPRKEAWMLSTVAQFIKTAPSGKSNCRRSPLSFSAEVSRLATCTIREKARFHKSPRRKICRTRMGLPGTCPRATGLIGWTFRRLGAAIRKNLGNNRN